MKKILSLIGIIALSTGCWYKPKQTVSRKVIVRTYDCNKDGVGDYTRLELMEWRRGKRKLVALENYVDVDYDGRIDKVEIDWTDDEGKVGADGVIDMTVSPKSTYFMATNEKANPSDLEFHNYFKKVFGLRWEDTFYKVGCDGLE